MNQKHPDIAKITFLSILLFTLAGGCFFAGKNWDSWFPDVAVVQNNPDSQPPKPEHNPGPRGVDKPVSSKKTPVTNPPEDAKPPKTPPMEIPKVTPPPKEIPKVTPPPTEIPKVKPPPKEIPKVKPPPKKTLNPAERAAIYREIEKDVREGKCDPVCIFEKVYEFQFSASMQQRLISQIP
jgi:hypothetical protein